DVMVDAGSDPAGALMPAIAHREVAAVERLLTKGAKLTLPAAICIGEMDEVRRLGTVASVSERKIAFAAAAFYGQAETLAFLIDLGVDLNAFSPDGFHAHATALHHAVDSGSLDAVKVLVDAGAELGITDRVHQGTPLNWAEYLERIEIVTYLRGEKR
ncbi:ankyrin repeat domain-containing protein, partial [bacterium]|nr:ankyrin repeat domain-containing protein [bacterium]